MFKKNRVSIPAATLLAASFFIVTPAHAHADTAAASHLPEGLPLVVTIRDGNERLLELRDYLNDIGFEDSPLGDAFAANQGLMQAKIGLMGLAAAAETDSWSAMSALLGQEAVIGIGIDSNGQTGFIAAAIAADTDLRDRFIDVVHTATGLVVNGEPDTKRSKMVGGTRVFAMNNDFYHAVIDDVLVMSNNRELMLQALNLNSAAARSMASVPDFREAKAKVPGSATAWVYIEPALLKEIDGLGELMADRINNPLGGFLLGGWSYALRNADAVTAWFHHGETVTLDVAAIHDSPTDEPHQSFLNQSRQVSAVDAKTLPRYLGEVRVDRDWAALFGDREDILTVNGASDVVNFSAGISTLLGQIDFMEDVLPKITGPARVIVARQDFSDLNYTPTPKLPALALVVPIDLQDDPSFVARLNSGAISAITLIGLDQGQKGAPQLMTQLDQYQGYRITYGEYPDPSLTGKGGAIMMDDGSVAMQFNFTPAISVVDDHFIIATTLPFMHDLIDAKRAASDRMIAVDRDIIHIDSDSLVAILRENTEELAMNRMLEDNESRSQAEQYLESIYALLALVNDAEISSRVTEDGFRGRLRIDLANH